MGKSFMRFSVPIQTVFGNHIRQLRKDAGLTLDQLSGKSGFSNHRLRAIERGGINLNLGTMLILAMSLDTTLHNLLSGVVPKLNNPEFFEGRIIPLSQIRNGHPRHLRQFGIAALPGGHYDKQI